MTSRRLWLLVSLLMLSALLLTGCDLPWPFHRMGSGGQPSSRQEVYVASLITRDLVQQADTVLAVEPQASTFYEGEVFLVVLNKWSGLGVGDHTETAIALTSAGEELAREEAQFSLTAEDLTATVMEPFAFASLVPGRYWIVIELDGVEQVRYQFQVIAAEG
ncbi:MAG TPA: hypothetical protein VK191_10075 [Symbiobacteriaceae bacterium]|nr:hypothetical protein [Symbiobacteriaceae bacterium]